MDSTNESKSTSLESPGPGQIKLQIRTARIQKSIIVDESMSIKDLRVKTASLFEVDDPALTVLIFGGKILKDTEEVRSHGIKDGQTIHLVIRNKSNLDNSSANTASANTTSQPTNTTNTPSNISDSNTSNNIRQDPAMNPFMGNLGDVQQRLQQMLISNPDTMQNTANPMVQQMMTNPSMIRSLFGSMQRMQMLMERNPEVNHLLSNPEVLRESLDLVRNPAALQEFMRNYDRALNNMESMPGGYDALRRMYSEFQEPLLNAFGNQFDGIQSSQDNNNESDTTTSEQQRTENRDPLPNPWASSAGQTPTSRPQFSIPNLGGNSNLDSIPINTNEILQRATGMFQDQEFMSLLTNPEAIQSVEQIQQGFERLQRIAPNLFGRLGIPSLGRQNTGIATNQSSNQSSNDNQQSRAGANITDALSQFLWMTGAGAGRDTNPGDANATTNTGATPNNDSTTNSSPLPNEQQSAEATRMLMQLLGGGAQGNGGSTGLGAALGSGLLNQVAADGQRPEERYSQQLQQLNDMGFSNREANLRALVATFGDINAAIARLLPQ